jgi:hypothetical protein
MVRDEDERKSSGAREWPLVKDYAATVSFFLSSYL